MNIFTKKKALKLTLYRGLRIIIKYSCLTYKLRFRLPKMYIKMAFYICMLIHVYVIDSLQITSKTFDKVTRSY